MARKTGLVITVCALAGLGGCGGGSSGPASPTGVATPTPTPAPTPVRTVLLLNTTFGLQNGFTAVFRTLSVSEPGVIEIAADWTSSNNDLDIALVRGTCTSEMYQADTCDDIAFADSPIAKPERLSINVTAGSYTPVVDNYGPGDESGAIQVVFTPGASATAASVERTPRVKRSRRPARSIEVR